MTLQDNTGFYNLLQEEATQQSVSPCPLAQKNVKVVGLKLATLQSIWPDTHPQNHKKIDILLYKCAAGPICPDRYGPYLPFSSGNSQEMSLYKPGKSSQSWRGFAVPTLGGF